MIYGAGTGGKILAECLTEYKIPVSGFVDKSADTIQSYMGLPVKRIDEIGSTACVVVSLLFWRPFIVSALLEKGIERNNILYLSVEDDCA